VLFPPCDQPICPHYQTVYMMEGPWPPDLRILTDECVFPSVCCIVVIVHGPKTAKAWTPMSVGSAPSSKALRLELGFEYIRGTARQHRVVLLPDAPL
jgi:hypothetical protein